MYVDGTRQSQPLKLSLHFLLLNHLLFSLLLLSPPPPTYVFTSTPFLFVLLRFHSILFSVFLPLPLYFSSTFKLQCYSFLPSLLFHPQFSQNFFSPLHFHSIILAFLHWVPSPHLFITLLFSSSTRHLPLSSCTPSHLYLHCPTSFPSTASLSFTHLSPLYTVLLFTLSSIYTTFSSTTQFPSFHFLFVSLVIFFILLSIFYSYPSLYVFPSLPLFVLPFHFHLLFSNFTLYLPLPPSLSLSIERFG